MATHRSEPQDLSQIIQIDEAKVSDHLSQLVRRSVEETLNGMLDTARPRRCATPSGMNVRKRGRIVERAPDRG